MVASTEASPTAHHPNCTLGGQASVDREMALRDNDSLDLYFMSPDAYRAAEAIEFIAEHLRIEDRYIQVSCLLALLTMKTALITTTTIATSCQLDYTSFLSSPSCLPINHRWSIPERIEIALKDRFLSHSTGIHANLAAANLLQMHSEMMDKVIVWDVYKWTRMRDSIELNLILIGFIFFLAPLLQPASTVV